MSRNLLDQETSPYLLSHKDNPVHWRPWGQAALTEAQDADKPILLSVGYTACHWCHVMNDESFNDAETAALLNEHFIAIKVDREERPDIDQVYQAAANTMGSPGGWPLTMILTPQAEPFFAGTFLPKDERPGQPAFKTILKEAVRLHRDERGPIQETAERVQQAFATLWGRDMRADFEPALALDDISIHIAQRFDIFFGGLTGAPKFPATTLIELMWRAYLRTGAEQFNQVTLVTLSNVCMGGLYDHVGGGFARYATDERWVVPHFEKMLYDNALLIDILTMVWQHNRAQLYKDRVAETIDWVLREMRVENAFASSLGADSDGEEGKFYTWSEAQIDAALTGTFVQRFKETYGVTHDGNFNGKNILNRLTTAGYPMAEADEAMFAKQRSLLLEARNKRTRPVRDDKVMADWNGMMIAALANAGVIFDKHEWIDAAIAAFDFICTTLGDKDRLFHSWRSGTRGHHGFADDYAHMARAALVLWDATGDERYLERAQAWTRMLNEHFWDMQNGGYFTTADEDDPLIVRARMIFDQVIPAANGVMASVLTKLYLITADQMHRDRINGLLQAFSGEVARAGMSMSSYVIGLETALMSLQIVIVGPRKSAKTRELVAAVRGRSLPGRTLVVVEPDAALPEGHPAHGKAMENGQPTAYVCQNMTCSPPVTNPVALSQMLLRPAKLAMAQAQASGRQAAPN